MCALYMRDGYTLHVYNTREIKESNDWLYTYIYDWLNGEPTSLMDDALRELILNFYIAKRFPQTR